jgi:hypothetical protein
MKLDIPPEHQNYYTIHQQQGDSSAGPRLTDEQLVSICQLYGDAASSLRFSLIANPSIITSQNPLTSTPSSLRGLPPSKIPIAANHNISTPQLSIDTRLGSTNAQNVPFDRQLPPVPTTSPPIPPHHTRPIPSSNQSQNQVTGYMKPPLSAHDDHSEAGSGYSGGAEDTPNHPPLYGSHHLGRMKSKGKMNIPSMPTPPTGPPPLPPMQIISPQTMSTVSTVASANYNPGIVTSQIL